MTIEVNICPLDWDIYTTISNKKTVNEREREVENGGKAEAEGASPQVLFAILVQLFSKF